MSSPFSVPSVVHKRQIASSVPPDPPPASVHHHQQHTAASTAAAAAIATGMSNGGGRRLPKRSILGTRVAAPGEDGRFYPAVIQVRSRSIKLNG